MVKPTPLLKADDLDFQFLHKELDIVKTQVFLGKNAAFLGSLMCSLNFMWSTDIETAATNGVGLWWNPYFFMRIPRATRKTVLVHELWHPAELDMIRRDNRDPEVWNWACDIRINNRLTRQGYTWDDLGFKHWEDLNYPEGTPPEKIYDDFMQKIKENPELRIILQSYEWSDIIEPDPSIPGSDMEVIGKVVQASQAATMAGEELPSDIGTTLTKFLTPKIPWESQLYRWFDEMVNEMYSMARPNRRYTALNLYMSSLQPDEGIGHLVCFQDVSGSVTDEEEIRFNSELKYIWDTLKPAKISVVQFSTAITQVTEYIQDNGDEFDQVTIVGRGGTDLEPVREWILEHKPSAVVVFSDLRCDPMQPIDTPILWVCINNPRGKVLFGDVIYIKE
ncbi:HNH endonuclease [Sinorhizobium phage ort11]|uniref:Putative metallopeptidase domain protein n=1 Tax=Sinorhizobium phage ort11 TaxID=2599764 RepID=A0A5C2H5J7_9CAUD|nr:HNH endonuclease [Sinorhizobium phage ort11]QEP29842.1 putative metallopeptidase domain protein [Sinorhizobium phage ort11]